MPENFVLCFTLKPTLNVVIFILDGDQPFLSLVVWFSKSIPIKKAKENIISFIMILKNVLSCFCLYLF